MGTEYGGMRFEWDDDKSEANLLKHGVSFFEAVTVFGDPLSLIWDDDEHSTGEQRFLSIGRSTRDRILIVSYAESGNVSRIISAREAEPKEVRTYEKGK